MVSKLLKGRGLWLQVSCKSFPMVYSWLRRRWENDLQLLHVCSTLICMYDIEMARELVTVHIHV